MSTRDALSTQKAKALAPALPETTQLRELFAAVEVALANHKGPAIERLRAAYEAVNHPSLKEGVSAAGVN